MPSEESRKRALETAPALFLTNKELAAVTGGEGSHVSSMFVFVASSPNGQEFRWRSPNGQTVTTP
jgi:bacteriocin-like protein